MAGNEEFLKIIDHIVNFAVDCALAGFTDNNTMRSAALTFVVTPVQVTVVPG